MENNEYKTVKAVCVTIVGFLACCLMAGAGCGYIDSHAPRRAETYCVKVYPSGSATLVSATAN